MPRIKNGFLFAAIVLLTVTNQVQGQTSDLVPPIDSIQQEAVSRLKSGSRLNPALLPLIDDIVDRAYYQSGSGPDEPTVGTCQLNAPLSIVSDSDCNSTGCSQTADIDGSAVSTGLMLRVTPEVRIQPECGICDSCGIEIESSRCEACADEPCAGCAKNSEAAVVDHSMDQYCEQLAAMLMTTLDGSEDNPQAQRRAIETALTMVAEKSNEMARTERVKLNKSKRQSLKQILMEHARQGQPDLVAENRSVLEPIYATQFRNSQQLTKLHDANRSIMQSLLTLEKRFASFTMIQRAKLSGAEVKRMMDALEEEKAREQELEKLQAELQVLDERIQQLQSNPVRRANHLEPIYLPARTLQPLPNQAPR